MQAPSAPRTAFAFDCAGAWCLCGHTAPNATANSYQPMERGQGEALLPLLERHLADAGLSWQALDVIGVGVGPGNFTGIRIAVSAARGLALGLGVPAVGVSQFELLAEGASEALLLCSLPAPRGQIYLQLLRQEAAGLFIPAAKAQLTSLSAPDAGARAALVSLIGAETSFAIIGHEAVQVATWLALPLTQIARCQEAAAIHDDSGATLAEIALRKLSHSRSHGQTLERPSPLYIRPADAAPSSELPPVILDPLPSTSEA